jgi:hypothetical protein
MADFTVRILDMSVTSQSHASDVDIRPVGSTPRTNNRHPRPPPAPAIVSEFTPRSHYRDPEYCILLEDGIKSERTYNKCQYSER